MPELFSGSVPTRHGAADRTGVGAARPADSLPRSISTPSGRCQGFRGSEKLTGNSPESTSAARNG
ncbi:hypothetical protein AB0C34_29210 [Nocardia sp. NPDC049220]|uniref:hypothetical protein n=1 Tax=Nocardia sp. NPDC049220 TaxID=3155273 RepID=UPI003411F666